MKLLATITVVTLGVFTAPHQVTHTRCLKLIAQDDFDRYVWVTRDGPHDDVDGPSCHPMRFWQAAMVEWPVEEPLPSERDAR